MSIIRMSVNGIDDTFPSGMSLGASCDSTICNWESCSISNYFYVYIF